MRYLFLIVIISILYSNTLAQKFYAYPIISLSLQANKLDYNTHSDNSILYQDSTTTNYVNTNNSISFGDGKMFGIGFGYEFANNIAFDLAVSYFKGNEHDWEVSSYYEVYPESVYNATFKDRHVYSYKGLNFSPSLIFSTDKSKKINAYIKAGINISKGLMTKKFYQSIFNNFPDYIPVEKYEYTYEYTPKVILGGFGTFDIEFSRNRILNFFAEARFLFQNFKPKTGKCVKYTYQGEDKLNELPLRYKEFDFVDSFDTADNEDNKRGKFTNETHSLSSYSISIGFRYYFKHEIKIN